MAVFFSKIIVLFTFTVVSGEEVSKDFGITNAGEEYLTVFRNIPTLFEYLLEMLDDKPEVLEKNDVSLFKRNAEYDKDGVQSKRSIAGNDKDIKMLADENEEKYKLREIDNEEDGHDERFEDADQVSYLVYGLTSEEVAEHAILVEQMLDEHNNSN